MGVCDNEVMKVLNSCVQPRNINDIEPVVIYSTRAECDDINEQCLERLSGNPVSYEAIDSDHNGHPLREADNIGSGWVNGTLAVVVSMHSNYCCAEADQLSTQVPSSQVQTENRDTGCLIQYETTISFAISLWSHSA